MPQRRRRPFDRSVWSWIGPTLTLLGTGCGTPPVVQPEPPPIVAIAPAPSAAPAPPPPAPSASAPAPLSPLQRKVAASLAKVTAARSLPAKGPVAAEIVSRQRGIDLIVAKSEHDLPSKVLRAQGEMLGLFGLLPPQYDFVEGIFALVKSQVTGFYDPKQKRMVMLADQKGPAFDETLAHELVHALQDQHWDLDSLLKYEPGGLDRAAAIHSLAEGDATSAMFEVGLGSAFKMPPDKFRKLVARATASSSTGKATPAVLRRALVAPYADGFAFVQALRKRTGWSAVDRAWARPPRTTEQLLHVEKYVSDEKAVAVPTPRLPPGYRLLDSDSLGEQGLRMVLAGWAKPELAAAAAKGWGGDRYAVAEKRVGSSRDLVVALHVVMDTKREALELVSLLSRSLTGCRKRKLTGPLTWLGMGRRVVIVAGPTRRDAQGKRVAAPGRCATANVWAARVITQ